MQNIYSRNNFHIDKDKKNAFLEKYKNNLKTYKKYSNVLLKIDKFEKNKRKSLFEMGVLDIKEFLSKEKTISTINSYASIWKKYVEFHKNEEDIGYLSVNQITKTFKIECLNKDIYEKQYLTKKEYYELVNNDKGNYQDKVIVVLLWNHIMGTTYEDIRNIKIKDIDFTTNSIAIGNRKIPFEDFEMNIIKEAIDEKMYISINDGKIPHAENGYLIKSTLWYNSKNTNESINKMTFNNKFSDYTNKMLERPNLKGKNIYASGIFYDILHKSSGLINKNDILLYLKENDYKVDKNRVDDIKEIMLSKMKKENAFNEGISDNYIVDEHELDKDIEIRGDRVIINVIDEEENHDGDDYDKNLYITNGIEGEKKYYLGKKFERSNKLRNLAIKIHGLNCKVCGFNFESVYGEKGRGYIEVHHKTPLYKTGRVAIDVETDLTVLCSNCHRIIHRNRNIVLEISELKIITKDNIEEDI